MFWQHVQKEALSRAEPQFVILHLTSRVRLLPLQRWINIPHQDFLSSKWSLLFLARRQEDNSNSFCTDVLHFVVEAPQPKWTARLKEKEELPRTE